MKFGPIKKVNISDEIYELILNTILNQQLKPGDKLPSENKLSEMFNVSRVSVRAAIQKLVGLGIVESRNGEGTYVKDTRTGVLFGQIMPQLVMQDGDMQNILDFRRGIEVIGAELAARNGTGEQIEELNRIFSEMELHHANGSVDAYSEMDMQFHLHIADMSGNTIIKYVMTQMKAVLLMHIQELNRAFGTGEGIEYHRQICKAITEHNPEEASRCMNKNIMNDKIVTTPH